MMEFWQHSINWINTNAGVFSLLAVIATIVIPIWIYRRNRKEELQQMQDRYEEMERLQSVAWPSDAKDQIIEKEVLKKAIKRGRK